MSDIYFKCECGKSLAVNEAGIGRAVSCVDCGKPVVVPEPDLEFDCEDCGAALLAPLSISGDMIKCAACGHRMTAPSVTQAACIHISDRVGSRGLRPVSLPHHRTCGFPHPAVETGGVMSPQSLMA